MTDIAINARSVAQQMTFRVKITGKARMRVCTAAAILLIRLASVVLGPEATIDVDLSSSR